jgi:AbrB family looped-hinge helix DNA binding protein
MNDLVVPIDKAGRVVLPKSVRDELAIQPGDRLKVTMHGNELTLSPTKDRSGFFRKGRALVFSSGEPDLLSTETVETIQTGERDLMSDCVAVELSSSARK